jgi:hypothetical protein
VATASTITATGVDTWDAQPVTPGWIDKAGTPLVSSNVAGWLFSNQSNAVSAPGSVSTTLDTITGAPIRTLSFNFGCSTLAVALRTTDCRNVVAMYAPTAGSLALSANAAISFDVRNADASAQFALRVKDSSGQTLQYRFPTRSIESGATSNWVSVIIPLRNPDSYWGGANNGQPQGTLSEVAIVASALNANSATLGMNYPVGKIEVREPELHSSLSINYNLAPNNARAAGPFTASYVGRLAVANNVINRTALGMAKSVGITVIRKDIFWSAVEKNGAFNFSEYIAALDELTYQGMKVLWILDYTHPDHGGVPPQTSADLKAFGTYATEVAKLNIKYPRAIGYEVWNEPNVAGFWPTPDPVKYGALLSTTTAALRTVDKALPIVSGGIAVDEPTYLYKLAKTGALAGVTAVGIHPYRYDTITVASPYSRKPMTPESYAGDLTVLKGVLGAAGVSTPMWNTEWGYPTTTFLDAKVYGDGNSAASARRQGLLTLRMVLTQLALDSKLITIYNLIDKGTDPNNKEHHFGLLLPTLVPKPAYTGLQTLYQHSVSRTFKGFLTDVPHGMHVLRWDGTSDRTFCAWADDPAKPVTLRLPSVTDKVTRWDGVTLTPTTDATGNKSVTLTEADGPVFVLMK